MTQLHRPDLIVYDAESDCSASGTAGEALEVTASETDTPILILGRVCPPSGRIRGCQFLSKPYHYGPLVRKIEELLDTISSDAARSV